MHTQTSIHISADPREVYELAQRIDDWPRILPHYRWVRVLREDRNRRVAAMSAWRGFIPVRWVGLQERNPEALSVRYQHVGGVTRGMEVLWRIEPSAVGTHVTLEHWFEPGWPLVPDALVQTIIGELFVDAIAARTLVRIRELAESRAETVALA